MLQWREQEGDRRREGRKDPVRKRRGRDPGQLTVSLGELRTRFAGYAASSNAQNYAEGTARLRFSVSDGQRHHRQLPPFTQNHWTLGADPQGLAPAVSSPETDPA